MNTSKIGIVMGGYINEHGKLMDRTELNDAITLLQKENNKMKEFINDCAVSHNETRYKYRAQVLLREINE